MSIIKEHNPQVIVDEDAALVCFSHCRGVLKIPPVRIDKRQPCFSATWATVNPRTKSAFIRFGNVAIFNNKEASYIVNDSGSKFLFLRGDSILEMMLDGFDRMPGLEKTIVMDREYQSSDARVISMGDLEKTGIERKKNNRHFEAYTARRDGVVLDDIYTILYTSGTTGRGKGVALTHHNCSARMNGVNEFFDYCGMGFKPEYTTLCFLPLAHIFDRGSCQGAAIFNGCTIAYADAPGTLLQDLQKYNPHWINCVPRLYEKIYIQLHEKMGQSGLKRKLFDWALTS
jgi:long-chain acyl-CoA synthetase